MKPRAGLAFSMTGYGSAEASLSGQKYRMEIRSVNHRFLDLKLRLPREYQVFDALIRSTVQSRLSRGSLDLKLERAQGDSQAMPAAPVSKIQVNLERARELHRALEVLRSELKLQEPITVRDVAQFSDVLQVEESIQAAHSASNEFWEQELRPLVETTLQELTSMRAREGAALSQILANGMDEIEVLISGVRRLREAGTLETQAKLSDKIRRILDAYPLDAASTRSLLETRLAQELALALDRTDIQEELNRFEGHITHFRKTLSEGQQLGRKLEFLLQELGREINTLGNKAQDLGISQQVVAVKVRLEQLREQVLNLE